MVYLLSFPFRLCLCSIDPLGFLLIGASALVLICYVDRRRLARPSLGQGMIYKGIPEPGTPGEAAASAALPSKAGGLGTGRRMRGRDSRAI